MRRFTDVPLALEIASYFLIKYDSNLSERKLNKLCYYAQGYNLAYTNGIPLFVGMFYAWPIGPVNREIFIEYSKNSNEPYPVINRKYINRFFLKEEKDILDKIWNEYGSLSEIELQEKTRLETPWKLADNTTNRIITFISLKNYFKEFLHV